MSDVVQVNFGHWFPVFPLAGVCLLPHMSFPLRVFEPRYVQMVEQLLSRTVADEDAASMLEPWVPPGEIDDDYGSEPGANARESAAASEDWRGTRQLALALFEGERWRHEYHGNPPIRPIICIAQIERYERLPGGRYDILVQGVCRARVIGERMPDERRMFRLVQLSPLDANPDIYEPELVGWRSRVRKLLDHEPLAKLRYHSNVVQLFDRDDVPSHVLVEFAGHLLMTSAEDAEMRYRLLAEPDTVQRAQFVESQLIRLERTIEAVEPQMSGWPKGLSWN